MSGKDFDEQGGDYPTGYRRPPKNKQFKPGRSGNPRGRPKRDDSFSAHMAETVAMVVQRKVRVNDPTGRVREIPLAAAMIEQYLAKSLSGKPADIRRALDWLDKHNALNLAHHLREATHNAEMTYREVRDKVLDEMYESVTREELKMLGDAIDAGELDDPPCTCGAGGSSMDIADGKIADL